ncbi:MAG: DJ-1/PfpI family protein [Anaerolineae bacterium]|nr:DJ-1/PfpI family protein [Anaerolineae bacterium]
MSVRNVAIVLFDEVEVLDFAGPFEVFSVAGSLGGEKTLNVYTVAEEMRVIQARGGLQVLPGYTLRDCPPPDIIVVPGGYGTRHQMKNAVLLGWLREQAGRVELLTSVCTGSLVLGGAGLLDGWQATTHHEEIDLLVEAAPAANVVRDVRYVDNGRIITSAGVQAGMDMALHVVARLLGEETARAAAANIEYDWRP